MKIKGIILSLICILLVPNIASAFEKVCGDSLCNDIEIMNCPNDCIQDLKNPLRISNVVYDEINLDLSFTVKNMGNNDVDLSLLTLMIYSNAFTQLPVPNAEVIKAGEEIDIKYHDSSEQLVYPPRDCNNIIILGIYSKKENRFFGLVHPYLQCPGYIEAVCGNGICDFNRMGLQVGKANVLQDKSVSNTFTFYGKKIFTKKFNPESKVLNLEVDGQEASLTESQEKEISGIKVKFETSSWHGCDSEFFIKSGQEVPDDCLKEYAVNLLFTEVCPIDCEKPLSCGNKVCEEDLGERSWNCPEDCSLRWYSRVWKFIKSIFKK